MTVVYLGRLETGSEFLVCGIPGSSSHFSSPQLPFLHLGTRFDGLWSFQTHRYKTQPNISGIVVSFS